MRLATPVTTVLALAALAWGCGRSSDNAPNPTTVSSVAFTTVSPPSGSVILLPQSYPYILPGGIVIPPGSGHLSAGLRLFSGQHVPGAQLSVYLLSAEPDGYCGQNSPDSPTWESVIPGWTTTVTVSGFRVYHLPCDVTGLRAMLHIQRNGLLTPPAPSETIAEATFPVTFRIER
jgi:hypothetical protein